MTACDDMKIRSWNVNSEADEPLSIVVDGISRVESIALSPDKSLLASANFFKSVSVYRATDLSRVFTRKFNSRVISATFLTNELIVVGVERDNMHVVDSKNGATVRLLAEIESPHSIQILADPGMLRNFDGTIISTHIAH